MVIQKYGSYYYAYYKGNIIGIGKSFAEAIRQGFHYLMGDLDY